MKKVFKSRIFLVIITAIICTTITVGATAIYNASEVGFTPTDSSWHVNNMEDAINDLYNESFFKFNTVPLASHNLYQKEYDVEEGKYYIFCTRFPTDNITVTGAQKLDTNLFVWEYNSNYVYLGIVKATSNRVTFSEKATIALLGSY